MEEALLNNQIRIFLEKPAGDPTSHPSPTISSAFYDLQCMISLSMAMACMKPLQQGNYVDRNKKH